MPRDLLSTLLYNVYNIHCRVYNIHPIYVYTPYTSIVRMALAALPHTYITRVTENSRDINGHYSGDSPLDSTYTVITFLINDSPLVSRASPTC